MRVLMIAERLPPAIGGVERHVLGLTGELTRRGHQVTLVGPAHVPGLPAEEHRAGVRIRRLPHVPHPRLRYLLAWRWWVRHKALLAEADVIHFHGVYPLLHWFGPAHLLCVGRPLYLTYHGYGMRFPIPVRPRLYHWLAARRVRGSICIGHFLVKWFRLRPDAVSYGAVTPPAAVPPLPPTPAALFLGRLDEDTGLDIYLRGLGLLARRHGRPLPLTVCGDGPGRPALMRLAQAEGVEATFLGFQPDPAPHLARASLVLTSGYLAMLEAMAHRRPVFSVYHSPVKADYLRLVPGAETLFTIADSPDHLAERLRALLAGIEDPGPRLERAAAFAARHTWAALADAYLALWTPARRGSPASAA